MYNILPFHTRLERQQQSIDAAPPQILSPAESANAVYKKAYDYGRKHCRDLVVTFKATGFWDTECEEHMTQMVLHLRDVCKRMSDLAGAAPVQTTPSPAPPENEPEGAPYGA